MMIQDRNFSILCPDVERRSLAFEFNSLQRINCKFHVSILIVKSAFHVKEIFRLRIVCAINDILSQPFFVGETFTGRPGRYVPLSKTISDFKDIINGAYDSKPEDFFYMKGALNN